MMFIIFRHLLIAFGGLAGLEECIEEDNELKVFWNSFLSIISITWGSQSNFGFVPQ